MSHSLSRALKLSFPLSRNTVSFVLFCCMFASFLFLLPLFPLSPSFTSCPFHLLFPSFPGLPSFLGHRVCEHPQAKKGCGEVSYSSFQLLTQKLIPEGPDSVPRVWREGSRSFGTEELNPDSRTAAEPTQEANENLDPTSP